MRNKYHNRLDMNKTGEMPLLQLTNLQPAFAINTIASRALTNATPKIP